ncbi:MAG: hypothetical protein AAFY88_17545 [Acidobacteriota bacterium]
MVSSLPAPFRESTPRLLGVFFLTVCCALANAASVGADEVEIAAMIGVYENLDAGLVPFQQGPVTLLIRSPEHQLRVHGNRLSLERRADGTLDAAFEADVEGWGQLIVDVQAAGSSTTFEDRVEVPRQWLRTQGEVGLERADGGWNVTFHDYVHDAVGVQIKSAVSAQVVDACRTMVSLGFAAIDCDGVQASLTRIQVPLPERGSSFLIRRELLREVEAELFDRFAAPPR